MDSRLVGASSMRRIGSSQGPSPWTPAAKAARTASSNGVLPIQNQEQRPAVQPSNEENNFKVLVSHICAWGWNPKAEAQKHGCWKGRGSLPVSSAGRGLLAWLRAVKSPGVHSDFVLAMSDAYILAGFCQPQFEGLKS